MYEYPGRVFFYKGSQNTGSDSAGKCFTKKIGNAKRKFDNYCRDGIEKINRVGGDGAGGGWEVVVVIDMRWL